MVLELIVRRNVPERFIRPRRQQVFGGIRQEQVRTQVFKRVPVAVKDRYKDLIPIAAATVTVILGVPVFFELIRARSAR